MNQHQPAFELQARDASQPAPVLRGVECSNRLDGVLFESTLRQRYRNDSERNLEVVYTFPRAAQAVLLGFASELNGMRMKGVIVAKREAEARYEKSLAEGDAPVMLEEGPDGLCTANIGNLKPGDELVIELRTAQVLQFEQCRLRLSLPTTIAPRYGSPQAAGLQPQQVPLSNLLVEYPLSLTFEIRGALATATVECPTHAVRREVTEGVLRLTLEPGARLDRDVVITVEPPAGGTSLLCQATDAYAADAPCVLMAAFLPRKAKRRESIALKVLVDCSGSMAGDSIVSARTALSSLVHEVGEGDTLSISRFGSNVEHVMDPATVGPAVRRGALQTVQRIEADLGGTEMEDALDAVFRLPSPSKVTSTDVLLLTDGAIWQTESVIQRARASGHRIFAIGVGSSPAEPLLRGLAEATGGACEFATPGEALEAAAARMLDRIRQVPVSSPRLDWGSEPIWQTTVPLHVFDGDTLIAFAGFAKPPVRATARLLAVDAQENQVEVARCEAQSAATGTDSLARLAAARRMLAADEATAKALAVRYQLMSPHTNCILVHERAAADKANQAAELHQVTGMHAAGSAGLGRVMRSMAVADAFELDCAAPMDAFKSSRAFAPTREALSLPSELASSHFTESVRPYDSTGKACLRDLADAVRAYLEAVQELKGLAEHLEGQILHVDLQLVLDELGRLGLSPDEAWLALARWVYGRAGEALPGVLRARPARDPALEQAAVLQLELSLGPYSLEAWTTKRQSRLARGMTSARR